DCVAMNVNDMICLGAMPLFFLDYIGIGRVTKQVTEGLLEGLVVGCVEAGCALIGGETSEMPDVYGNDDYDLVGFAVGALEEGKEITGATTQVGDVVIGLPSSGVHSNGFTLARKALFEHKGWSVKKKHKALGGKSIGEALLEPTRIYVKPVLELLRASGMKKVVRGMAHITGGGLVENLPRALPKGCAAKLHSKAWNRPAIFDVIQSAGDVNTTEMYRVFNMGIGFTLVVAKAHADFALKTLHKAGEKGACIIGEIVAGNQEVTID
ncbi:MAG: phosphoribosylformylglycinamidine cyclo-ligase, partial [Planctomycetes bacterium]|nr:phosphoribosylformylglycinamidine cyclo-ligase [Planctomycetota bacterium]